MFVRIQVQEVKRKVSKEQRRKDREQGFVNETVRTILSRRSVREFTDEPVPKTLLDVILQAGIYAPSGYNIQTWRFTVMREREQIQKLKEVWPV